MKAFARGLGLEPEKVLTQAAFAEPHRAYMTTEERDEDQTRTLSIAIKELIKKELLTSEESQSPRDSLTSAWRDGAAAGIRTRVVGSLPGN